MSELTLVELVGYEDVETRIMMDDYKTQDVDEYLSAVFAEDCMPSLDLYFKDKDKAAQEWARNHNLFFVG